MTVRSSSQVDLAEWPGELRRPDQPITADFFSKLPEGPPFYELIEGNLILQNYSGNEELRFPARPVTADLFLQIPEGPPYYELIEGHIVMSPTPNFYHQKILIKLAQWISNYLDEHPMGTLAIAPCDVRLGGVTVFEPDLFFARNGNPNVVIDQIVEGAPDLVVEILSPTNFKKDRNIKRPACARTGVREMWIVDPKSRQIEVYDLAENPDSATVIVGEPGLFLPAVFPGLTIETTRLFQSAI